MPNSDLDRLAALIRRERDSVLAQWREQVRALPSARLLAPLREHAVALTPDERRQPVEIAVGHGTA